MNNDAGRCPSIEELSAYLDGELEAGARGALARHAAECPLCGARIDQFTALGSALKGLPELRPGIDIAALVDRRIAAPRRARPRRYGWSLAPQAVGGLAALAAGAYLALMLPAGAALTRPGPMAVLGPSPPGALCAGRCLSGE